ncbi:MAG: GNAT family N-acetyltransferase [Pseudomonadota bacterium]
MRPAQMADIPQIKSLLQRRIETSMFPLSNLIDYGLKGTELRAQSIWVSKDVSGVLCLTNEGMILPQLPNFQEWSRVADILRGRKVIGCLGATDQVNALLEASGLAGSHCSQNSDEPLLTLLLANMQAQTETRGRLVPLEMAPLDTICAWRTNYHIEIMGTAPDKAQSRARADIEGYVAAGTHRALMIQGVPVSMTGFNAVCGDTVQVGGVYTPSRLRRNGYAEQALSLHLHEARANGTQRALLFAASQTAAGVYNRIGFQQVGQYSIRLFRHAEVAS